MKILTCELSNKALDYAVALCLGGVNLRFDSVACYWMTIEGKDRVLSTGWSPFQSFSPSALWEQGGPIIEREKISIELCFSGSYCEGSFATPTGWKAAKYKRGGALNEPAFRGPTPLIAAMRCYVASKLGDEVDIPDELA